MIEMCSKSIIVEVEAVKQHRVDENSFGQRLKKEREKKGLTQAELIKMANEYGGTDMPESVPALWPARSVPLPTHNLKSRNCRIGFTRQRKRQPWPHNWRLFRNTGWSI